MLELFERDLVRKTAQLHGQSVAQIRRRIATGFLECIQGQDVDYAAGYGPAWDLRLGRDELEPEEMRMIGALARNYEDGLDRLCVLWVAGLLQYAEGVGADQAYDEHMRQLTGEPGDWWP